MNYQFHEVANLFPMMDDQSFSELCRDIKKNGLIEPIWLHEGQIIDGRNRYKACQQVGVEPKFREWNGEGSLTDFVISLNVHRRHLDKTQLACVAALSLPHYEAEAKERQREAGASHIGNQYTGRVEMEVQEKIPEAPQPQARDLAAASVGVNPRYVSDAKRIQQEAPETFKAMQEGKVKIKQAIRELTPKKEEVKFERKPMLSVEEGRCSDADQFAEIAILQLERIKREDPKRVAALQRVKKFINQQLGE